MGWLRTGGKGLCVGGRGKGDVLGSCVRQEGEGGVGFTQLEEEGRRLS